MHRIFLVLIAYFLPIIVYSGGEYEKQIKRVDECTLLAENLTIDSMGIPGVRPDEIQTDKAKEACLKSQKVYPNDPHILYLLARIFISDNNHTEAFKLAKESCEKGDSGGCTLLGFCYDQGIFVKKHDTKKAYALWVDACNQGNPQACNNVADVIGRGLSYIPKDTKKIKKYFLQACKSGMYPYSCLIYTNQVYFGRLLSDAGSYEYALMQSCAAGFDDGCYLLENYLVGKDDPDKHHKIMESLKKSCKRNNLRACGKIKDDL